MVIHHMNTSSAMNDGIDACKSITPKGVTLDIPYRNSDSAFSTFEGIRRKAMFNAYPCRRSSPANALPTNPEAPVNKTLFIFIPSQACVNEESLQATQKCSLRKIAFIVFSPGSTESFSLLPVRAAARRMMSTRASTSPEAHA